MQLHLKTNPYYHIGKESSLKISWLRLVSPQQFDLCDDEYLCQPKSTDHANHIS